MRYGKHLHKSKVLICLLAYFLGWMESANALPLLFVALDDSHKAIVTENHGKIHLTVHHLGNGDKHEHDLPDSTAISSGMGEHSDHEIGVCGGEQFVSPATKIIKAVKDFIPSASVQTVTINISSQVFTLESRSPANRFSPALTTVLLI